MNGNASPIGIVSTASVMSVATIRFSDSQSRVFRWLFGQPEREFHLCELCRLTGFPQRELNRLAEARLPRIAETSSLNR